MILKYQCSCGYIYDPHKGDPPHGIEPMPFEDVPKDWECPNCGQKKENFDPHTTMSGKC